MAKPKRVNCKPCKGKGGSWVYPERSATGQGVGNPTWVPCPTCKGKGTVLK